MRKKIKSAMLTGAIGVFLVCCLAACSPWKKMVSWMPFRDNEKSQYGLTDKKIEEFTRTIKSADSDAESHYRLACFFQERKKHRLAIEEFIKALQNDPEYVKAYNGLGVSYDLLGDFPRAVKAYETALRLNPNLAYVYNNLGYSWLLQKQLDAAVKAFQQAVALDQENRQYHNNLALAYGKQGKYDLAFNEFKLGGNEEQARRHLARLFNHVPTNVPSQETLVAENVPTNDDQNTDQENPAQPPLKNQGIREERLAARSSGSLVQENHKQLDEPKDVVLSKEEHAEVKAVPKEIKDEGIKEREKPTRYAARNSTKKIEVISQPFSLANNAQSLSNNLTKSPRDRQSFPVDVDIEISNGNGVALGAQRVGCYLAKKGFTVASLNNAPRFDNSKTIIYYCEGYLQDAYQVAKQIPRYQDMVKVKQFENPNIKIRVVIGSDMVPYYKKVFFKAATLRSA